MREIEYFRNISVGQFFETESWARRLAPGVKLLFVTLSITSILLSKSLILLCLLAATALILAKSAQISPGFIARGLKPAAPFILIIALLQILFMTRYDEAPTLLELWRIRITSADLTAAALIMLRFTGLMFYLSFFTAITPTPEIVHGTEQFLRPLVRFGIPAHEISMVVGVAFRFIPILAREIERIIKAQVSRGADFGSPKRGLVRRIKSYFPLFVPFFVSALERAEKMIVSMEARCYTGGKGRSQFILYPLNRRDVLFIAILVPVFSMTIWAGIVNIDSMILELFHIGGVS
jgi:energy-coupling factor transport system permease protein